jgi:hypothetical protein
VGPISDTQRHLQVVLLALQAFQGMFLWIHDWVPLGRLNDVAAVRAQDTTSRLIRITLVQSVPFTIGLVFSVIRFGGHYPGWLIYWLWISYGVIFVGQLRAWWVPYLLQPEPARAARYQVMFGKTHSFHPQRHHPQYRAHPAAHGNACHFDCSVFALTPVRVGVSYAGKSNSGTADARSPLFKNCGR